MRKRITWIGSSRGDLLEMPELARQKIGHQLNMVQQGLDPEDWKPFATVGPGAQEIRVQVEGSQFRSIYVARFEEAIYVLHCFSKKEQKTSAKDVDIARRRYKLMSKLRSSL